MLPLHPENQEVELFGDEMNQEVILSIIFAGISIWIAGETEDTNTNTNTDTRNNTNMTH
jgi:hypothetical protein